MAIDFYNNYITNSHDNPDRNRRQHAQHPRHAEHVDQSRIACFCNNRARRTGVLDSKHRLQPARRVDAAHWRSAGGIFYNNTLLSENRRYPQNSTAQITDARSELHPTIFSVSTNTNLHVVRLQRFGPIRAPLSRSAIAAVRRRDGSACLETPASRPGIRQPGRVPQGHRSRSQ